MFESKARYVTPDEIRLSIYGLIDLKNRYHLTGAEVRKFALSEKEPEIRAALIRNLSWIISSGTKPDQT